MPETEVEGKINQEVEVHNVAVRVHSRRWVDNPNGDGFYTLDGTQQGDGSFIVTSYLLNSQDLSNRDAIGGVLSDWETSPVPSKHREPARVVSDVKGAAQVRFIKYWSETVRPGYQLPVETFRGRTPVRMVFQAA